MPQLIAALVFAFGILGLFVLDRDGKSRASKALWIPVAWLLINASRPVSVWLQMKSHLDSPEQYLEGSPLDRLVFGCLLLAGLIVVFGRVRQAASFLRANPAILLFFGYCAVSTLWSDYPGVAFKRWIKGVGDLVMVMIVLTDSQPTAALKRLLARAGFLLLPTSILLINYYPNIGRAYDQWTWQPIIVGVTTNKNTLGLTVLLFGLGAVWRFFDELRSKNKEDRRRHLIAQGALLAMTLWLLVKAHSATSLACFFLAGILLAVTCWLRIGRKLAVVHLSVLTAVAVPLFALFVDAGGGAIEALGRNSTLTGRTEIWNLVLGMVKHPIIGTGYESFWLGERLQKLWNYYYFPLNEAHNGYIELFLNLGWIGVALLAVLFITGYRNAVAAYRRDRGEGGLRLAFIVVVAVYSLTEAGFRMLSPGWIFFLLASSAVPEALAQETLTRLPIPRTNRLVQGEPENVSATLSARPVPSSRKQIAESDPSRLKRPLRLRAVHKSKRG
jgi:exopolysaccharide production protein ExoQ